MSAEPEQQTEAIDPVGHIVRSPGVMSGRPRIAGTRMRVVDVADWHQAGGMSVLEITEQFNLNAGDVHAALAYYHDHRDEIEAQRREDEEYIERMKAEYPDRTIDLRT